jgi:hypothetical protein
MNRQNVSLRDADVASVHCRWLSLKEAQRLETEGRAKRLSRPGDKKQVYQLLSAPEPSRSERSTAMLTAADMRFLSELRTDPLNDPRSVARMHPDKIARVQRLIGHGLLREIGPIVSWEPKEAAQ